MGIGAKVGYKSAADSETFGGLSVSTPLIL